MNGQDQRIPLQELLVLHARTAVGLDELGQRVVARLLDGREDQLDRMKTLGIVPSFFSAHVFFWGDWHRDSVLGAERGSRISPTRSAWDREMPFTLHNDAPVVPPDMIRLIWATTNRKTRSDQVLGADQTLTTFEALSAITRMAAYQNFEEDEKGK